MSFLLLLQVVSFAKLHHAMMCSEDELKQFYQGLAPTWQLDAHDSSSVVSLPEELKQVVTQLLSRNPEARGTALQARNALLQLWHQRRQQRQKRRR